MAISQLSLSCVSFTLSNKLNVHHHLAESHRSLVHFVCNNSIRCSSETNSNDERCCSNRRQAVLLGVGALALSSLPANPLFAEELPINYQAFVDRLDGYSYYYPSDWREFDFRAHDSAFKDRYLQLQNVRVSFIPTEKTDIHEMGPIEDVVFDLVTHLYAAPSQQATIFEMQDRNVNGKNYYTFEYDLTSRNFSRTSFVTIAIANGRFYTLNVGANERRWRRVRNQLKVVADSFKVMDIQT